MMYPYSRTATSSLPQKKASCINMRLYYPECCIILVERAQVFTRDARKMRHEIMLPFRRKRFGYLKGVALSKTFQSSKAPSFGGLPRQETA